MDENEEKPATVTVEHIEHILNGLREIKSICAKNKQEIETLKEIIVVKDDNESLHEQDGEDGEEKRKSPEPEKREHDKSDAFNNGVANKRDEANKPTSQIVEVDAPTCKKPIYDLPTFGGELDQWPLFYANLKESTRIFKYDNRENLMRLQKCLVGAAREVVSCMLIYPDDVPSAIEELQHRFGKPELLAREQLHKLQELPAFGESKMDQMVPFATKVRNSVALMVSADCEHYLADTLTLEQLVRKIPPSKQYEWVQYAADIEPYPTIHTFSSWLNEIARVVCLLPAPMTSKKVTQNSQSSSKQNVVMHVKEGENQKSVKCHHCGGGHKLIQCSEFLTSDTAKKWDIVKSHQLCFVCLNKGHGVAKCRLKKPCGIGECKRHHNPTLHDTTNVAANQVQPILSCRPTKSSDQLFKILRVTLCGPKGRIETYAIFDNGSAMSLIEENIADQLGLSGHKNSITLQWFGDKISTEKSRKVDLEIYGEDLSQCYSLRGVNTVANLSLPTQTFVKADFPHLQEFPIEDYIQVKPVILLGLDNAHLETPSEVTENTIPVAARTKLGWVAYGSKNANVDQQPIVLHINQTERDDELHKIVEDYFCTENFGTNNLNKQLMSNENTHAKQILESTTKRIGSRFETGLLWKEERQTMPDSYESAKKRLLSIEKKMSIDNAFAQRYETEMAKYFEKGYAKVLSNDEAQAKNLVTWYLPHFAVSNVHKPDKCRIVFDAAASVNGVSLNSQLSKGPEQAKPLLHILFKFRMNAIGVAADIREMFSQVKIREEDQQAQRFLWRNANTKQIEHCVMTSMIFGATCSPCCAEFVKNKNANEFRGDYPQAAAAIVDQHYVDDFVASFASEKEAITLCKQVVQLHSRAGFELRNFVSNSERLEVALNGQREVSHLIDMQGQAPAEKVLGMHWNKTEDVFEYRTKFHRVPKAVVDGVRAPTKREMLSITMSVFDPFGLIADFLLLSKILIQETWKCQIGWDDAVPDHILQQWRRWWLEFGKLKHLQVPRRYSLYSAATNVELHIFVDASELAFVAAAYFRFITEEVSDLCFVLGKTRNAPKRLLSIPRLELQAAVLGVRVCRIVQEAHAMAFSRIIFWSDSRTVLYWIHSSERKYRAFVGHRIAEILEYSEPQQWRWVPTELNSADAATRPNDAPKFEMPGKWLQGPSFLREDESNWPEADLRPPQRLEEEIFPVLMGQISMPLINFKKFSSFLKLKRHVAWLLRAIRKSPSEISDGGPKLIVNVTRANGSIVELKVSHLRADELIMAERVICRMVQQECYAEEISNLRKGLAVNKSSTIYCLSPYLDEFGILRLSGRFSEAACLPFEARFPILLPKQHEVTQLIIRHYHEAYHHQNFAMVINEIRQKFWIPHIKVALKNVQRGCPTCERERVKPKPPQMGPLPFDRVTPVIRPFTYTGVDLFGPINVTIGRRHEKRWVAIYTCLTMRAIHLEVVENLSTDAFLLSLRNFVNRRGTPVHIRCDNGTNFIGAQKELKQQERLLDVDRIVDAAANRHISWIFNCPANPSSGGCWERLIRIIKRLLHHTLKDVAPRVETLRSVLIEAENIVNSRPLTDIPLSSEDEEPITPNHFLIGLPNSTQTPHDYEENICLKKQWLIAQNLKNRWWKRWTTEYLPQLLTRAKWHNKTNPIQVDDVVLVCDPALPRSQWYKGRVVKVFPNKDGQVRIVEVKTSSGIFRRPATKLAVLTLCKSG